MCAPRDDTFIRNRRRRRDAQGGRLNDPQQTRWRTQENKADGAKRRLMRKTRVNNKLCPVCCNYHTIRAAWIRRLNYRRSRLAVQEQRKPSNPCEVGYKLHFNKAGAARQPSCLNRFLSQPHVAEMWHIDELLSGEKKLLKACDTSDIKL